MSRDLYYCERCGTVSVDSSSCDVARVIEDAGGPDSEAFRCGGNKVLLPVRDSSSIPKGGVK